MKYLYPDSDSQDPEIDTMPMKDLLSRIAIRQEELIREFPIGTHVTFMNGDKEVSGIISQFVPYDDRIGTGVSIKGVRGGFSLVTLVDATITHELFDSTIDEIDKLRTRVSSRARAYFDDKPVDLSREVGRTTAAIMKVLTKGKNPDLESISDDQIDREIFDRQ